MQSQHSSVSQQHLEQMMQMQQMVGGGVAGSSIMPQGPSMDDQGVIELADTFKVIETDSDRIEEYIYKNREIPHISFPNLLEFAIQKTYKELHTLADILATKSSFGEETRKSFIVQFAYHTRVLFIRILAAVKWYKMSRMPACKLPLISFYLDHQSALFVNTADSLWRMAKEDLPLAMLPMFQVASAIDVLTLGTYPRLSQDIKDRFVSPAPLTEAEQRLTLRRLNKVLEYQMAQHSLQISPRFEDISIRNGMVTLTVPGEFEIALTRLGETEDVAWCLLNIRILVESHEVGFGQRLVHPLQVNFLHQIVQERLHTSETPLLSAYEVLHTFCQMLQLDVLFCQAQQMAVNISSAFVRVDEYDINSGGFHYWLQRNARNKLVSINKITIFSDKKDIHAGLRIRHYPHSSSLPTLNDSLSLGTLLNETVLFRCRERLLEIRHVLESISPHTPVRLSGDYLLSLHYPLIKETDSHPSEFVHVYCLLHKIIADSDDSPDHSQILRELERHLNVPVPQPTILSRFLQKLRTALLISRYNAAICGLQVSTVSETQAQRLLDSLAPASLAPAQAHVPQVIERRVLQFHREDQYYLIVLFVQSPDQGVAVEFQLISTSDGRKEPVTLSTEKLARLAPVCTLIKHLGSDSKVNDGDSTPMETTSTTAQNHMLTRYQREPHTFLQSVVSAVDDRLQFIRICEALMRAGIKHEPVGLEPLIGGHLVRITSVPGVPRDFLRSKVRRCNLRLAAPSVVFDVELIDPPLYPDLTRKCGVATSFEQRNRDGKLSEGGENGNESTTEKKPRTISWVFMIHSPPNYQLHHPQFQGLPFTLGESVAYQVAERLMVYYRLHGPVQRFADAYHLYFHRFCNVHTFSFYKLVIAYGDQRQYCLLLSWKQRSQSRSRFELQFGQCSHVVNRWNPHTLVAQHLSERFNQTENLEDLINYLINTYRSLDALQSLARERLHSMHAFAQNLDTQTEGSQLTPQQATGFPVESLIYLSVLNDESTIRLSYGSDTHIEFKLLRDNAVAVRNCSTPYGSRQEPQTATTTIPAEMLDAFWRSHCHDDKGNGQDQWSPTV